jgi:hypothetical protein
MDRATRTVVNAMKTPVKKQIQEGQWMVSHRPTDLYANKVKIVRRTPKTVSISRAFYPTDDTMILTDPKRYKIFLDEKGREYIQTGHYNYAISPYYIVHNTYYLNNDCVHFDTYEEMDKIKDWQNVWKDKGRIIKAERIKKKRTAKMLFALVRTNLPLDVKKYITQWF